MEIKTSAEVWDEVPYDDKEDIANTKKWVSCDSIIGELKEIQSYLSQPKDVRVQTIFQLGFLIKKLEGEK